MHCREIYCLLHVVVQGPGSFRGRSTFLCDVRLRSYGASNLSNFRILAYFSHSKSLKRTLHSGDQPTAHGLHRILVTIFLCSRRSKGMPSGSGGFLRLLVGELGTPKLAQIFAYGKWLYPYRMLLHGALDLDQRCLKTRNSEDGCTFPPNILARLPIPPKLPKTPFWGTFQYKTYYTESSP